MSREQLARQALGSSLHNRIREAKVLLVGAGGIGCELLKNLVLTGFKEIHLVDLDTIDLSNLNRQFLFRHEHIKKSKALVAKESAHRFNPHVKTEAYHANIQDTKFSVRWFSSFHVVFNALDNLQARRHVNKMCLAANVPLIESGTMGYNGQVQVIKRGKSECYDCNPKETPKTFPVCTIRSTPSQPIHCIVWAKSYLLNELFGESEEEPGDFDHSEDSENAQEIKKLKAESAALKEIRNTMGKGDFSRLVFQKVFKDDVERLRSMEDMWKTRQPPKALDFDDVKSLSTSEQADAVTQDQKLWSLEENVAVFKDSIQRLSARAQTSANVKDDSTRQIISFDKDDVDTLDFVAAASNLRSIIFNIELKSKFDIKQMAGNIIPAIATTNAVTAGFCVLQSFKVLKDQYDEARMIFLTKSTDRFISADRLQPPNPACAVCSAAQSQIDIDLERATLGDLVGGFLKMELGYGEELSIMNDADEMVYDQDLDDLLPKKISELGIKGDSFLKVRDDEEGATPRIDLILSLTERSLPKDSKPVVAPTKIEITRVPAGHTHPNGHTDETKKAPNTNGAVKQKRTASDAGLEDAPSLKKGRIDKPSETNGDGAVVLDDDAAGGAIVIED